MKNSVAFLLFIFTIASVQAQNNKSNLLIGTYTTKCDSKGIYVYDFDAKTGNFNFKNSTENVINPSFLSISSDNKYIYSVNENGDKSTVSAFDYKPSSGKMDLINIESAKGADPCYIINDKKNVIVANYSSGSISVFGRNNDGSITKAKQIVQHNKELSQTQKPKVPHAHMVSFSPDKKYVLATDLGIDKIYSYEYDPNATDLILKKKDSISVKLGSGPRHLTFSKNGKFVYLLQENDGTVTVFRYLKGTLEKIEENTVVSKDFNGTNGAADIHISPDGKFLYATNRGTANDISIFKILKNGKLEKKSQISTGGNGPRSFAIDPSGKFLLIAHQYTNNVVIFKRNRTTGSLTDTGKKITLCAPVCLVFGKK
ncbi:lactonase family protein [Flavobacterium weaverense]|uniref:6-phosphogluconolactonase n=1 Tax=Flavobacterium weaverense TaxID=271156 RepID=A0A3L9ZYL4_9FLAO|nr:lactonase family protein [Flavobacterium weaverense]RMA76249.1 6-phosphogluconolactonase [Flavobacterium weaverense]